MSSDRRRDIARGLAAGDAVSWTAARQRERLLPERRMWMLRYLDEIADADRSSTRPLPHVHSSPVSRLRLGPVDDLEWFVFALESHSTSGAGVDEAWERMAEQVDGLQARTGTLHALRNLRRGQRPPQSGHDNPHFFDDLACVRAVAIALVTAPDRVRAAVEHDAAFTHSEDGVWCATATGVLISELLDGGGVRAAVEDALRELPEGSWSRRLADLALETAAEATSALDRTLRLDAVVVDRIYSYGVSAPESFALLIGHAAFATSADELLLGALGHARNADALPALAGATAGAIFGSDWLPALGAPVILDGVSIPSLAGRSLDEVLDEALSGPAVVTS